MPSIPPQKRTKQNQGGRKRSNNSRVSTFFHDCVDDRNGETAEDRWKCAHSDIGDVIFGVTVTNIFEQKSAVKSHEPSC